MANCELAGLYKKRPQRFFCGFQFMKKLQSSTQIDEKNIRAFVAIKK